MNSPETIDEILYEFFPLSYLDRYGWDKIGGICRGRTQGNNELQEEMR